MLADSDSAIVLGWTGTIVADRCETVRPMPGVRPMLDGARSAEIPVILLTPRPLSEVARGARRLRIASALSMVIADVADPVAELRALRGDFPRLAVLGSAESEITAAIAAGAVAFGYSGGRGSGPRLRAAGAESVLSRLDRGVAQRVTASRLFAADGRVK